MMPLVYLAAQTMLMWILVFVFYRLRKQYTLIPVYCLIAASTFLAQHLANPGFEVVFAGLYFVIGSVVFFTTVMLGVLILYLFEGPRAARLAFRVIIFTTIFYDVSLFLINQQADYSQVVAWSPRVVVATIWSLLATTADIFFIAIFWELLARVGKLPLILQVFLVIFGTFALDTLIYVTATFGTQPEYLAVLKGGLIVRFILALVATPLVTFYLKTEGFKEAQRSKPTNFWEILNFRSDLEVKIRTIEDVLKSETALLQDMKKFKMAVESASDHIVITDADGTILFANKGVEKVTGFSLSEVIGKKAGSTDLWGGLMPKEFYKQLWKTIKVDKKSFSGEITNHRKTGEKYISMATISPVLDNAGNVQFFVSLERDISKEKEVDRMKTEFVSLVTHQLRTPITSVSWGLQYIPKAGKLNADQQEALQNALVSNTHMSELVTSLLNISRIESGRLSITPKPTNLLELGKEVIAELKPALEAKKIKVDINSSFDQKVKIDVGMIREVYKNLIGNAVKYSGEGSKVLITIKAKDKDVVIKVKDSGMGIPVEDQTRVFEKFFRASNSAAKIKEGTGLGLYLTKQLVEASGGQIGFESEVGKGTTFWFSLPMSGVKAKEGAISLS